MNMFDSTLPISSLEELLRKGIVTSKKTIQTFILGCMVAFFFHGTSSHAQVSDAPFLEFEGLVVMEAESVPRNNNWQFENIEEGFGAMATCVM